MTTCPECHTENPNEANYCMSCGAMLININELQAQNTELKRQLFDIQQENQRLKDTIEDNHTIYYEATKKIESKSDTGYQWIEKESISHEFENGKGKIFLNKDVTIIDVLAFQYCDELTSITIPQSINSIGYGAFWGCSNLASIDMPDSVTRIGARAFYRCLALTEIKIPDSVTYIGDYAFEECDSLKNINIPDSVTRIGAQAFESYIINNFHTGFQYIDKWCVGYVSGEVASGDFIIADGTKGIADNAFYFMTCPCSMIIPKSIKYINANPFPSSCEVVSYSDEYIIENDMLLTKEKSRLIATFQHESIITIPNETKLIEESAIFGSNEFDSSQYPPYLIRINNNILNNFYYGNAIYITPNEFVKHNLLEKGVKESNIIVGDVFVDEYGVFYSNDKTMLICYPRELKHKEYHIIDGCKVIKRDAFKYFIECDVDGTLINGNELETIHIPESLEIIEDYALEGCEHLTTIKYPKHKESFIKNILQSYYDDYQELNKSDKILDLFHRTSELTKLMQPELQSE